MSSRLSILFVDDDAGSLTELRRIMREGKALWDVHYAQSGKEALELIDIRPVDVVCSDMIMPKMSGVQLLDIVKQFYPQITRIILTANDSDDILRLTGNVAHASICKTAPYVRMQEIIEDSVDAKSQRDVKDLLRSLLETWVMPVAQTTLAKLDELCQNKRSASEIAECIATDACMTADLIRSMNHPDFGLPRKVVTPYEGILWAGVEKVMTAVASFPVFSSDGSGDTAVPHTFTRDLWAHCALTGRYAKAVAEKMRLSRDDQYRAQVAGVMHDIGKVFIIKDHWRVYRDVIDRCQKEKESLNKLEQQLLGLSHAELGGRLLERWNLDPEITDTIRFHHSPRLSQSKKVFGILAAVHIADAVASEAVGAQAPFKALVDVEYLYEINAYREYPSLRMHCLAQDK